MSRRVPLDSVARSRWVPIGLACFAFLICYLRSFALPNTPILLWGDQLGFATKGTRILAGEIPYRDYFEFVTPGTALVYGLLFRVFGVSVWMPNLVMGFLAATMALLMTLCARRVVRGGFILLPGLLLVGFVLYGSLDATHHWFSTVAVMAAVWVLFDGSSFGRVAVAGGLCGLAASFTQTKGVAVTVGLVIYLVWQARREGWRSSECWRRCFVLCGAALGVFIAVNGPFVLVAGIERWVESVIIFPARYFRSVSSNALSGFWFEFKARRGGMKWIFFPFMYVGVPMVYAAFFAVVWRRGKVDRGEPWDKLMLVAIAGVAMLAVIAPSLSIRRISTVSPPAMILLGWLLSRRGKMLSAAAGVLGVASVGAALGLGVQMQMRPGSYLELPVGRVVIPDRGVYEVYGWMAEHTRPGQWYFGLPPLYLPLGLRNPTPLEAPAPGEFSRPEQIALAVEGIEERRVPLMVLRPAMYVPHLLGDKGDHLQPFQDYLYGHYRRTKVFSTGDEVWERLDTPVSRVSR
jgi:hypothetical protein